MQFNSNDFLIFFGLFLAVYYLVRRSQTTRNLLIVAASYIFYGWWDYRFVPLLFLTSLVDYGTGLGFNRFTSETGRKSLLSLSIVSNLSVLFVFKYFDFFKESLEGLLASAGWNTHWRELRLILPVGISFYTFQSLSYVVDVYRGQLRPTANFVQFLAYVSFFPQLVAGPIERATNLLGQFARTLRITAADLEQGVWLILWGLFKKVVLADNLAPLVELVFDHSVPVAPMIMLGAGAFALQIFCDFSGYTDIARGLAKILGFELMANFNLPYFATSVREFWRRWHISLSTWFRDYVYVPLGGNRGRPERTYLNVMATMLLAGLWHGAALNFVLWGLWHGAGLAVNRWWAERRRSTLSLPAWLAWSMTVLFVLYGWILFRAPSPERVLALTEGLSVFSLPLWWKPYVANLLVISTPLVAVQIWQHRSGDLLVPLTLPISLKASLQAALLFGILAFWNPDSPPFIYFQF